MSEETRDKRQASLFAQIDGEERETRQPQDERDVQNEDEGIVTIQEQIENRINEFRDEIGSRVNNVFIAANKLSSNVRQALDLETDPGLLEEPDYGDIICVHRIGFEHYGVYVGDDKVIHYDIDPTDHYKICVHQAPMAEFLNGSLVYSICEFPKLYGRPTEEVPFSEFRKKFAHPETARTLWDVLKISNYHLYTPEETV
ncbi:MAG: lecithin retinol acyltransferase family protein, partial [Acidaminococcaceae bacterium]|nr:lecithin retinol acyltransferase family protein [Acidaminococcaceae bacterium]